MDADVISSDGLLQQRALFGLGEILPLKTLPLIPRRKSRDLSRGKFKVGQRLLFEECLVDDKIGEKIWFSGTETAFVYPLTISPARWKQYHDLHLDLFHFLFRRFNNLGKKYVEFVTALKMLFGPFKKTSSIIHLFLFHL